MRLMTPVTLALLITLAPTAAMAQNPPSSGKKLKWVALGSVIGGAALGAFAAFSEKETKTVATRVTASSHCVVTPAASTPAVSAVVACVIVGQPAQPNGPLSVPTTFGAGSVSTSFVTLSNSPQRGINWKLAGPAIGATSVGGFLLYRYHVRVKKADVSLRPDGAVQLAFTW
jgi:hypothetical protein